MAAAAGSPVERNRKQKPEEKKERKYCCIKMERNKIAPSANGIYNKLSIIVHRESRCIFNIQ